MGLSLKKIVSGVKNIIKDPIRGAVAVATAGGSEILRDRSSTFKAVQDGIAGPALVATLTAAGATVGQPGMGAAAGNMIAGNLYADRYAPPPLSPQPTQLAGASGAAESAAASRGATTAGQMFGIDNKYLMIGGGAVVVLLLVVLAVRK